VEGVGKAKKVGRMLWCVAGGHRRAHRKFLKTCGTISLHQDGRRGRLLLRYRACDSALTVKCGTLGQVSLAKDGGDLGALGIAAGTVKILDKLCTELADPPLSAHRQQRSKKWVSSLDAHLLSHVKRKAELLDSDAAADEQRAHKVLKHGTRAAPAELPNLKVHNLDKAHSSRRIAGQKACNIHKIAGFEAPAVASAACASAVPQGHRMHSGRATQCACVRTCQPACGVRAAVRAGLRLCKPAACVLCACVRACGVCVLFAGAGAGACGRACVRVCARFDMDMRTCEERVRCRADLHPHRNRNSPGLRLRVLSEPPTL
jgi:hypothetical protein